MTPAQIISLVRDTFVVAALGFVVWWIHASGGDRVKIADMKAVQKQLDSNAQQLASWKTQASAAEVKHEQEIQLLATTIASQRAPVYLVRHLPDSSLVPSHPASAANQTPSRGRADTSAGSDPVDIRPQINAFETQYERALSDCRQVIASWPH